MKTVLSIQAQIQSLESQLQALKRDRNCINMFSKEILDIATEFSFEREAKLLADLIAQRDFPLTRKDIEHIFETSGFEFTQDDIDLTNPDSEKATQDYNNELMADYRSIYG